MPLIVGIILLIALLVFAIYSSLAIKHAARFRYLSARTVYLTVFYVATSSVLIALAVVTYVGLFIN